MLGHFLAAARSEGGDDPGRTAELQGHEDRLEISADSRVFVRSRTESLHGRSRVGGSAPSLCQRARCYQSHPWDLHARRLISSAASAVTQVLSRKVAGHDAPETSNTYMVLAGFILASLPLAFVWHTPASGPDALVLCSLGIFGGLGHYCLVRAFELAPAPLVSPFNYAQILGAAVLSSAVFGQAPDLWTWIGSASIVFSGVFI